MRSVVCLALLVGSSAYGQYVISAHSGVIQLVDGRAFLDDKDVAPKFGQFPDIKQDQIFRTEEGRAEVLLTPGVFLRMGENSSIRMVSNRLTDTRVEVLGGSVMVECDEISKDNAILLMYKGDTVMLVKHGLYRIDTDPARVQVYDGEAVVKSESGQLTLKGGRQTGLGAVVMAERFDKNSGDELYRWSGRRASYLAKANVSSAMALRSSGGYSGSFGGWQFNPLFGLFTFVPYTGIGYSPFGYGWWSPIRLVTTRLTAMVTTAAVAVERILPTARCWAAAIPYSRPPTMDEHLVELRRPSLALTRSRVAPLPRSARVAAVRLAAVADPAPAVTGSGLCYFRFFSKKSVVFSSSCRRIGPPTAWLFPG